MSMDPNLSQLGRDIGRTVQKVLSEQNFAQLKHTIEDVVVRQTNAAVDRANQAVQRVVDRAQHMDSPADPPAGTAASSDPHREAEQASATKRPSTLWMRLPAVRRRENGWGLAAMLTGVVCAIPTGIAGIASLLFFLASGEPFSALFSALLFFIPCLLCVALAVYGKKRRLRMRRYERYLQILGTQNYCEVSKLAQAVNGSKSYVIRDLQKMMKARMFLEGYFDEEKTTFMTDMQSYRQYLELRQSLQQQARQREEQKRPQSELDRALSDVRRFLERLHQLNVELPMEEISLRLDSLEEVITKILEYVSEHEDKLPEIRQFGAYYLPTTVKLVEAYQELERHQVTTAAVDQTKKEILQALENIHLSFQTLFDQLIQDDLLDVSTEISALQAMLAQEGLSADSSPFSATAKTTSQTASQKTSQKDS